MDVTDRVNDLIKVSGRLADLLERENKALSEKRHQDISVFLDEKISLARAYEAHVEGLMDKTEDLAGVDADLRERLRGLGEKVKGLMEENSRHLKVEMEVNRHVMDAIAEAAKTQKPGPGIYSSKGSTNGKGAESASQSVAVSIDRSL